MYLHFIGADHEVTGSCHVLEAGGHFLMIDRGMEQGKDLYENADLPCDPSRIEAVLVTHAHIDHTGLIPLLYAKGFRGKVYATPATCDLCDIMLRDSAHIQEFEAEWRNRKAKRQGKDAYVPLYTMADTLGVLSLFEEKAYDTIYEILPGIRIRFTDVGHLLGSASIEVWAKEDGIEKKIVFSGDIGNTNQPLLRDPQPTKSADYVLIESTYGDRSHGERVDYIEKLIPILQRTLDRGGNLIIPSFAVGRTQEMLYFLRHIKEEHLISGHDDFSVVVDSPLANEATTVFNKHTQDCFDDEARALVDKGINPIGFPGLTLSITSEDSIALNADPEPKVILSASGMCDAGRIKHHLKHNLWRPESTILFVGYQAQGSLGRTLLDGASEVKLFGETIAVQAELCELPGISGHADREGLLAWASGFEDKPARFFVVHGEDSVCDTFAETLSDHLSVPVSAPYSGAVFDLGSDAFVLETAGTPIKKEGKGTPAKSTGGSAVYTKLVVAAEALLTKVKSLSKRSDKELDKVLDAVTKLTEKL